MAPTPCRESGGRPTRQCQCLQVVACRQDTTEATKTCRSGFPGHLQHMRMRYRHLQQPARATDQASRCRRCFSSKGGALAMTRRTKTD